MDGSTRIRLEPVRASSLRDGVVNSLRKAIVAGVFEPGEPLREVALAKELGVSRGPVREALIALSREGLVRSRRNRSATVIPFSGDSIDEVVELRWLLESHVVRKLVGNLKEPDFAILENLVAEIGRALEDNDPQRAVEADMCFHEEIVRLAGNSWLHQVWVQLATHIRLSMSLGIEIEFSYEGMVGSHMDILEALRRNDMERVLLLIDRHFDAGTRVVSDLRANGTGRSESARLATGEPGPLT